MNRRRFVFPIFVILIVAVFALAKCGGSSQNGANNQAVGDSTSINAPAPDNNSANNPSLADTAYQRDSSGKKRDTLKR